MADFTDALTEKHVAMIEKQPMFFVATASADGRINLSPKGYDAFRVLSLNRVAYLDLGGSGNETHAHLTADGRISVIRIGSTEEFIDIGPTTAIRIFPSIGDQRVESF